jgi:hypothetical protein
VEAESQIGVVTLIEGIAFYRLSFINRADHAAELRPKSA